MPTFRFSILDPKMWVLLLVGTFLVVLSVAVAFADDKMQKQMIGLTAQLDGNCSATLIHSKRDAASGDVLTVFLTAKHCVSGLKTDLRIDVPAYQKNRVVKRESYVARVRGEWYNGDLALIELKDKQTWFETVAKIAPAEPEIQIGDPVWTVGYPKGWSLTITDGMFGAIETQDFDKPGTEYYRATPDIAGGNSGGGFWHINKAGDYELIGATAARARSDSFIGLYARVSDIYEYLKVALPDALPKSLPASPKGN